MKQNSTQGLPNGQTEKGDPMRIINALIEKFFSEVWIYSPGKKVLQEVSQEEREARKRMAEKSEVLLVLAREKETEAEKILALGGVSAAVEIHRRNAQLLLDEVERLRRQADSELSEYRLAETLENLSREKKETVKKSEQNRLRNIVAKGTTIFATFDEKGLKTDGSPFKEERRLVEFDGQVSVVLLRSYANTTSEEKQHEDFLYVEYTLSGGFHEAFPVWGTTSLSQMSKEELEFLAAYQAKQ